MEVEEHYALDVLNLCSREENLLQQETRYFDAEEKEMHQQVEKLYQDRLQLISKQQQYIQAKDALSPAIKACGYLASTSSIFYGVSTLPFYPQSSLIWISAGLLNTVKEVAEDWQLDQKLPQPLKQALPYLSLALTLSGFAASYFEKQISPQAFGFWNPFTFALSTASTLVHVSLKTLASYDEMQLQKTLAALQENSHQTTICEQNLEETSQKLSSDLSRLEQLNQLSLEILHP